MTTYVLVPGFWLGGWVWRPVMQDLRARGHEVYPVTLTGLGERSHLAHSGIDLNIHITDVANVLRYEDLHDVVLVGHSYAGLVVTGVADQLPDRVARLVYIDTGPLPDGFAHNDFNAPEEQAANAALVAEHGDGWRLPPPRWAALAADVPDADQATIAMLQQRSTPQPWASATAPQRLTGAWEKLPRVGVLSSFTEEQARGMAAVVPTMRHMDGDIWRYVELPTWHWPMINRPGELAAILAGD